MWVMTIPFRIASLYVDLLLSRSWSIKRCWTGIRPPLKDYITPVSHVHKINAPSTIPLCYHHVHLHPCLSHLSLSNCSFSCSVHLITFSSSPKLSHRLSLYPLRGQRCIPVPYMHVHQPSIPTLQPFQDAFRSSHMSPTHPMRLS